MSTHETRPANEVDARQLDGTQAGNEAVRVWARSYLGENSVTVPNMMSWTSVAMQQDGQPLIAAGDQYVYWDGTIMRVAEKSAFELVYRPIA